MCSHSTISEFCQQVAANVLETYRTQYADLDCDGIYFQSFTEYMPEELGGVSVAEAVVGLVNEVGGEVLEEYEDLQILFGLHVDCALLRLDAIQKTDSRISIIWEEVGAFPYHYMPHQIYGFEKPKEHTRKIRDLREDGFGVVLKGVICLDWSTFQHQRGAFSMGVSNRKYTAQKAGEKREILRYIQA